jgi:hypothetical protein
VKVNNVFGHVQGCYAKRVPKQVVNLRHNRINYIWQMTVPASGATFINFDGTFHNKKGEAQTLCDTAALPPELSPSEDARPGLEPGASSLIFRRKCLYSPFKAYRITPK